MSASAVPLTACTLGPFSDLCAMRLWCRYMSTTASTEVSCRSHTTESSCKADTANSCLALRFEGSFDKCVSNAQQEEDAKCRGTTSTAPAGGPVCEYLKEQETYCQYNFTREACAAKTGCKYVHDTLCAAASDQWDYINAVIAGKMGSSYASRILAVTTECSKFTNTTCKGAMVNGAAGMVTGGSMLGKLWALLAAFVLALAPLM